MDFSEFAALLPEPLCVINSQGEILQTNQAAATFLGLELSELVGKSLYQLVSDSPEKLDQMIRNWSRCRSIVPGALSLRRHNGESSSENTEIIPCNCSGGLLRPKSDDSPVLILLRVERREIFSKNFTALNDKIALLKKEISERRLTQQALTKSKAEFEAIFNSITDGIIFADKDRRIVMANPAFKEFFGYSEQEFVGKTTEMLYLNKDEYLDQGRRRYRPGADTESGVYESRYKRKDGSVFWADTLGTKVVSENGETIGFLGLIRDISERKKTENELKRYREDLEQLVQIRTARLKAINNELEAFSYSVSHDLRSPLRGIDGFSQALLEDYGDILDDEGKVFLNRIRHNAQHMATLIDNLLELSRIPRMEIRMQKLNLSRIAESVVKRLRESEPERQVEVSIAAQMLVKSDKTLLTVAIENLIGNAWKYTGGVANACIEVGSQTINNETVYFVKDNGVGFDMRYADKLFGVFQRMHVSREFEGTGVGLATVNRIIHRHEGKIWAESEVGKGTTLFFTLAPPSGQVAAQKTKVKLPVS